MNICRIAVPRAIDHESIPPFLTSLAQAESDDSIAVVVLHGSDGIFCKGLNLETISMAHGDSPQFGSIANVFADLMNCIMLLPKPVIAEVDGTVLGGGVGVAAACDIVVATRRSSFGLPEALFGLIPAIIAPLLLQRMAPQKLRKLALTCVAVDADHAASLGLVDMVVEEEMLQAKVQSLAHQLRHADPGAVGLLKNYLGKAMGAPVEETMLKGAAVTASLLGTDRVRSRIGNFISKIS
jgi:polyketide biosynthesis enoyl-CoA hydratase PksH